MHDLCFVDDEQRDAAARSVARADRGSRGRFARQCEELDDAVGEVDEGAGRGGDDTDHRDVERRGSPPNRGVRRDHPSAVAVGDVLTEPRLADVGLARDGEALPVGLVRGVAHRGGSCPIVSTTRFHAGCATDGTMGAVVPAAAVAVVGGTRCGVGSAVLVACAALGSGRGDGRGQGGEQVRVPKVLVRVRFEGRLNHRALYETRRGSNRARGAHPDPGYAQGPSVTTHLPIVAAARLNQRKGQLCKLE